MKNICFAIFLTFVSSAISAQEASIEWAKSFGGPDNESAQGTVLDGFGGVVTYGKFDGTIDFDSGPDEFLLTSDGDDNFIVKTDSLGNFVWAKILSGIGQAWISSLNIDENGDLYILGFYTDSIDFDPGPSSFFLPSVGNFNTFICKLDLRGTFMWAENLGGMSSFPYLSSSLDISGNVVVAGSYYDPIEFDTMKGTIELTPIGGGDIFIAKISSEGVILWAKGFGGTGEDYPYGVTVDSKGHILTAGSFYGASDFDPGDGVFILRAHWEDGFILKLDPSGNFVWVKQVTGKRFNSIYDITCDFEDNVLIAGIFTNTTDFDPGEGTFYLTSAGSNDIFITKLNPKGEFIWARRIGGKDIDESHSIATDDLGNVYTSGTFRGSVDLNPGADSLVVTSDQWGDFLINKLDSEGDFVWTLNFDVGAHNISVDKNFNIFIAGTFIDTVDFDPGNEIFSLTSKGSGDFFILKLTQQDAGYCESRSQSNFAWIEGVKINGFTNRSGFDDGYGNYTVDAIVAESGSYLSISAKAGFLFRKGQLNWKIWIDFNADSDFEDLGEIVFEGRTNGSIHTEIFVPDSLSEGEKRLRISAKYGTYPLPCEVFDIGETEDYSIDFRRNNEFSELQIEREESLVGDDFVISPNPSHDQAVIKIFTQKDAAEIEVSVYNSFGMKLHHEVIENFEGNQFRINTEGMKQGFYFVNIQFNGFYQTKRWFVK